MLLREMKKKAKKHIVESLGPPHSLMFTKTHFSLAFFSVGVNKEPCGLETDFRFRCHSLVFVYCSYVKLTCLISKLESSRTCGNSLYDTNHFSFVYLRSLQSQRQRARTQAMSKVNFSRNNNLPSKCLLM